MGKFERIAEIARQMEALDRELKLLVNATDAGRGAEGPATVKTDAKGATPAGENGSLAGQMLKQMERKPRRIYTTKKMTADLGLPKEEERAVRLNFSRLFRTKKIARVARGRYRYKERQGSEGETMKGAKS